MQRTVTKELLKLTSIRELPVIFFLNGRIMPLIFKLGSPPLAANLDRSCCWSPLSLVAMQPRRLWTPTTKLPLATSLAVACCTRTVQQGQGTGTAFFTVLSMQFMVTLSLCWFDSGRLNSQCFFSKHDRLAFRVLSLALSSDPDHLKYKCMLCLHLFSGQLFTAITMIPPLPSLLLRS